MKCENCGSGNLEKFITYTRRSIYIDGKCKAYEMNSSDCGEIICSDCGYCKIIGD